MLPKIAMYKLTAKVTINMIDLNKYRGSRHPEVTELEWRAGPIDSEVLSAFPNIQRFDCSNQRLDNIGAIGLCPNLRILNCYNNRLAALGVLKACTKLTKIDCRGNSLVSLVGLEHSQNLVKVKCSNNYLTSLEGLEGCNALEYVRCSHNRIQSIQALRGCTKLLKFECDDNWLQTLDGLDSTALTSIDCSHNHLVSIRPLASALNLESIVCSNNNLSSLAGLESKLKLKTVCCNSNKITNLTGLAWCTALEELVANRNKLRTVSDLRAHVLVKLDVSNNYLSVFDLGSAPKLVRINCGSNVIRTLEGMDTYPALTSLNCDSNCIDSLVPLARCVSLKSLSCDNNMLTSLDGVAPLQSLQLLYCDSNCLTTLDGVAACRQLQTLWCRSNCITRLEPIIRLRQLSDFKYDTNPMAKLSIQVEHYLLILEQRASGIEHIYADNENVMNTAVKDSTMASIQNILKDPPPTFSLELLNGSGLSSDIIGQLTAECANSEVSSHFLITYKQLLGYVWQRIQSSEHRCELVLILEQQVREGTNRCLLGRLTRLLTVLMGFYDDISIAISPSSQIAAVVWVTERAVSPYNSNTHRELAAVRLLELGYSDAEAQPWLDAIHDLEEVDA